MFKQCTNFNSLNRINSILSRYLWPDERRFESVVMAQVKTREKRFEKYFQESDFTNYFNAVLTVILFYSRTNRV